jgi:hypothetical protein
MHLAVIAAASTTGFFLGMVICSEIGRRVGKARLAGHPTGLVEGVGAVEGAVFGLLGLLIAFTFSGAASRFEDRRHLITEEANDIGTAYLRVDLLPADAQPEMRGLFRRYLEARTASYRDIADQVTTAARHAEAMELQTEIWGKASAACLAPGVPSQAGMLLLPALNEMIDITTTRATAAQNHPPAVVFVLLAGLSLVAALLVGYGTSTNERRPWFYNLVFAGIMSVTVYVIVDLEVPRLGLIRIDAADQVLIDLRKSMR